MTTKSTIVCVKKFLGGPINDNALTEHQVWTPHQRRILQPPTHDDFVKVSPTISYITHQWFVRFLDQAQVGSFSFAWGHGVSNASSWSCCCAGSFGSENASEGCEGRWGWHSHPTQDGDEKSCLAFDLESSGHVLFFFYFFVCNLGMSHFFFLGHSCFQTLPSFDAMMNRFVVEVFCFSDRSDRWVFWGSQSWTRVCETSQDRVARGFAENGRGHHAVQGVVGLRAACLFNFGTNWLLWQRSKL